MAVEAILNNSRDNCAGQRCDRQTWGEGKHLLVWHGYMMYATHPGCQPDVAACLASLS
jgi:hypothetical protein